MTTFYLIPAIIFDKLQKCCKLRSPQHSSVPERMGLCYSEAAVSVTVTSITNILSFFAGAITPFPCVRIFCIYTGIAVMFIYVWQLTFFGACLAIAGRNVRTFLLKKIFVTYITGLGKVFLNISVYRTPRKEEQSIFQHNSNTKVTVS